MINIFLFVFLGTLGWGVSLYLIKILLVSLTPSEIVLYRALIGAASLFILAKLLRLRVENFKYLLWDGLVLGLFNMALPLYLTSFAEKTVSSALASIINGLTPLCVFLLGLCFFASKQKFNFFNLLSILLGSLGILLVNYDAAMGQGNMLGLLALVVSCLSYGLAANYVKAYAKTKEPILVSAMASALTFLMILPSKLSANEILQWGFPSNWRQFYALLWLGVIGTGLSLYLYCLLIERVGAVTASMITYLMTVTGVLLGMILLKEQMSSLAFIGCVCLVVSLIAVNHASDLPRVFKFFAIKKPARQL